MLRSCGRRRWNSPTFCAVCGLSEEDIAAGKLNEEHRDNQNVILKGSYFLSTDNSGSHSIVAGFDAFEDSRQNDNYQSGTSYRVQFRANAKVSAVNPVATIRLNGGAPVNFTVTPVNTNW